MGLCFDGFPGVIGFLVRWDSPIGVPLCAGFQVVHIFEGECLCSAAFWICGGGSYYHFHCHALWSIAMPSDAPTWSAAMLLCYPDVSPIALLLLSCICSATFGHAWVPCLGWRWVAVRVGLLLDWGEFLQILLVMVKGYSSCVWLLFFLWLCRGSGGVAVLLWRDWEMSFWLSRFSKIHCAGLFSLLVFRITVGWSHSCALGGCRAVLIDWSSWVGSGPYKLGFDEDLASMALAAGFSTVAPIWSVADAPTWVSAAALLPCIELGNFQLGDMFCYSYVLLLLLCAMTWLLNWVAAAMAFASMALAAGLLCLNWLLYWQLAFELAFELEFAVMALCRCFCFHGSLQILQIVGAITILQMQIFHGSLQILLPWFCWNWANGEALLFCSL
ncbi:hypothetical protein U1Q18_000692 [Sarracenia purpurea var. burkii]